MVTSLFDELNRLKSRDISPAQGIDGVTAETYEYDALSRVTRAVGDNFTVARKYDSLNRVNQENQTGNLIQYTHSVVDNRRKMAVQYSQGRIFERDFDILDRISKLSIGRESIADFSYIGKAYRMLSKQCGNGDAIDFVYDQGRRLNTKETKNRNQGLINKYIYGYNRVGMKMFEQRVHDGNKGDAFAYDEVYRLTGVKFNSPEPANPATALFEKRWASQLDKVDNILKIVRQTADGATEITTTSEGVNAQLNQYTRFDEWGLSYDLNGNTTQRGTQHITYDYRNRIVSVQGLGVAVKYNYDPFNRRVEKILGSGTVKYLYDGDQVIEERDGNDNILRQYVWGNGVDELIAIYVKDGDTFKAYYPHTNGSGSITAITDDQGEVIERVTYDVYGMPTFLDANNQPLANNQSTIGNTYLFQGREYDKETNLYYYRARYYDPIMGRFLQTDPMGYQDSMNLYQGFNMNPVNFMDPFGLFTRTKGWIKGSAFLTVGTGDNAEKLASLIPGITVTDVRKNIPNFIPNQEINVEPLIKRFEGNVRGSIARYAQQTSQYFGLMFGTHPADKDPKSKFDLYSANLTVLTEEDLKGYWQEGMDVTRKWAGCFIGSTIVMLRGLIDNLNSGEYDKINSTTFIEDNNVAMADIKEGDQTQFSNLINNPNNIYGAEWVIKVGDDQFWGFVGDHTGIIQSYQQWKVDLAKWDNPNDPDPKKVEGFSGFIKSFNYFRLAQTIFDLRNK